MPKTSSALIDFTPVTSSLPNLAATEGDDGQRDKEDDESCRPVLTLAAIDPICARAVRDD
jgi:hypothetical protein